jgi:hypothetical protein
MEGSFQAWRSLASSATVAALSKSSSTVPPNSQRDDSERRRVESPLGHICFATATRPFVAGDTPEMQALQTSGGALNVEVLIEFSPIFECYYVEPS